MQDFSKNNDKELTDNWLEDIDFAKIESSPNLLLASLFWEEERREAALLCYNRMRQIDDLVDDAKSASKLVNETTKLDLEASVNSWLDAISNGVDKELSELIERYKIPVFYWESFAKAMLYDVHHSGFKSISDFLWYAEGAAVAPASLFIHFCGVIKKGSEYRQPAFNCIEIARPCALFSYFVHIIRDFQKDQQAHLNYFANDVVQDCKLNHNDLYKVAQGTLPDENFRNLMKQYKNYASKYREQTLTSIRLVSPYLVPKYLLSIEVIFALYDCIFQKIDTQNSTFSTAELSPGYEEVRDLLIKTVASRQDY